MITEDYVSFEIAKLLEEKGFDEKISSYYEDNTLCLGEWFEWNRSPFGEIAAPSHAMAMKWLREKGIHIVVYPSNKKPYTLYMVDIGTKTLSLSKGHLRGVWNTYEQAVEAALKYCLENLI